MLFDVFISYATEDKENFVRPLAERLRKEHVEVWYDEFSLTIGDSLRRSIDKGLSNSRFGIVIFSNNFFNKQWPQKELDGLLSREISESNNIILPIWHNITHKEIVKFSPILADKVAIKSTKGIDWVTKELIKKIKPMGSPLIIARDILIQYGIQPPVITDEWWLDIVEASNRLSGWGGYVPDDASWDRWSFPLPEHGSRGEKRGEWLAWTAMQMKWVKEAKKERISQITVPEKVLKFIANQKGLSEICHMYPLFLAAYAPQLTIKGLGGEFEEDFDYILKKSTEKYKKLRREKSTSGSGLTINKIPPACDEDIALRHETFGDYKPEFIINQFINGEMWGPNPRPTNYKMFDYTVWLISKESLWLPTKVREYLIKGLDNWRNIFRSEEIFNNDIMLKALKTNYLNRIVLDRLSEKEFFKIISKTMIKLDIKDDPKIILDFLTEKKFIKRKRQSKT